MKTILTAAAVLAAAAAAVHAQEATTLQSVVAKGIVMKTSFGFEVPVSYTPDGKFHATPPGAKMEGVWRIEGEKLCTQTGNDPEVCVVYPAGKKSGDTFDVPGAMGPTMGTVVVRIN